MNKLLLGLVCMTLCKSAIAGVVFQINVKDHKRHVVSSHEVIVEKGNLKMDISSDDDTGHATSATATSAAEGAIVGQSSADEDSMQKVSNDPDFVIYNAVQDVFFVVDHARKEYINVTEHTQALNDSGESEGDALGQLGGLFRDLPQEQKEALGDFAEMLKEGAKHMAKQQAQDNRSEIRSTGEHGVRGDYPYERYEVVQNGVVTQELWITAWDKLKRGDELRDVFGKLDTHISGLTDGYGLPSALSLMVAEDGGFPIVTRDFVGGELERESVLESVTERDLDPDAFEPPKGYRLRTMGGFFQ